jgi:TonB-dependent starch-binding outer membrane protein SusC
MKRKGVCYQMYGLTLLNSQLIIMLSFVFFFLSLFKASAIGYPKRDENKPGVLNLIMQTPYRQADQSAKTVPGKITNGAFQLLQGQKVTGTVIDSTTGEKLAAVNILIEGTSTGVVSDGNGQYSIEVPAATSVLLFSYIGYVTKRIEVRGSSTLNVSMVTDIKSLEEAVVIGYGTQSKKDVSGSITYLTEKDFNNGVNRNALDLIQGKVAGLSIYTTSSDVTTQSMVYLRGISSLSGAISPFYVINGIPGMDINLIAPEDIESISVLKDASASSIYGSRAASGVILITTKTSKSGQLSVEYSGKVMAGFAAEKPPLLTASEYRDYAQKRGIDISPSDKGANTDWFEEITNDVSISQEHHLALSGGSGHSNYRVSFNYLYNQGIVKKNFLERYNLFFTNSQKAMKGKLRFDFTGEASKGNSRPIDNYWDILGLLPVWPVKNPDGTWFEQYGGAPGNVVHSLEDNNLLNKNYSLYLNAKVDYEIIKGLSAGLSLYSERVGTDNGSSYGISTGQGFNDHGNAFRYSSTADRNMLELTLKYQMKRNNHNLELLGGYSYEHYQRQYFGSQTRSFITDAFGYNNLVAGDITKARSGDMTSGGDMSKLIGFFGRINYNFRSKYIIAGTLRRDGSSKFGASNKWGTFPSGSVAWIISNENFMRHITFLSDLKLRLGYGVTGNQAGIGPYNSVALYESGPLYLNNGNWENTYQYSQNANPHLKWEETATLNAGMDFSFFKGRLGGSIDIYNRKTSNLLYTYPVPVPPYLYPTILANVGEISNKGIELMAEAIVVRNRNLQWSLSFNMAHNKQLIVKLSNDQLKIQNTFVGGIFGGGQSGQSGIILKEGEEISSFYGPKCQGLDSQGRYIYKDIDNNDTIDSRDKEIIGHALPRLTYGITNTVTYKGFELSFFLRGVYGNDVFNNGRMTMVDPSRFPGQVFRETLVTPLNIEMQKEFNSYYIEKGSFLRLQNLTLGYNFNTKNELIKKCKVYIAGENLFVITNYSGMDPEMASQNGIQGVLVQGIDPGGMPPLIRSFILGINITF